MGRDGEFNLTATDRLGRIYDYQARKLIVSPGYYDLANEMRIPGEDLPKVFHYYREPHPYFDTDVLVIGGKNSAAISALDLWRHGARVTLVHRGPRMHNHVKYWILPDIENRIKNGEIAAYFNSAVTEIDPDHVLIETPQGELRLKNDFFFLRKPWPSSFASSHHTGVPFWRTVETICSDSLGGTRGSFFPAITKSGLVMFFVLLNGAIRSRKSRILGSRSSPYSTLRKSWRYPDVCSRNVTRFDGPTTSTEQQMRLL